jgi:hypothetical protein
VSQRFITIWRTWCGDDMAQSDSYYPTRRAAEAAIRENYDGVVLRPDPDDEDLWSGDIDGDGNGFDVHLERLRIVVTRAGLCRALKNIPMR